MTDKVEFSLPQLLRIERAKLDMSQEEFASAMDVSRSTIARWELGAVVQAGSLAKAALTAKDPLVRDAARRLLDALPGAGIDNSENSTTEPPTAQ